jgi:hypothetical protein
MGRIRTIKPEFTQDEELSSLPAETHLLAAGLLCYSDDDGYFNANHGLVKAAIFPLRESSLSIHDMLTQLANIGFIRLGTAADGKHYGQVVKFTEHQRVNRPTPSKIKNLPIQWESSVSTHGGLSEDSLLERKGKEGKGRERKGKEYTLRPNKKPVRTLCLLLGRKKPPRPPYLRTSIFPEKYASGHRSAGTLSLSNTWSISSATRRRTGPST